MSNLYDKLLAKEEKLAVIGLGYDRAADCAGIR